MDTLTCYREERSDMAIQKTLILLGTGLLPATAMPCGLNDGM